jgi:hypothetical protein
MKKRLNLTLVDENTELWEMIDVLQDQYERVKFFYFWYGAILSAVLCFFLWMGLGLMLVNSWG